MSAAASNRRAERHLHVAGTDHLSATDNNTPAREAWTVARPPLLRVCAGEPLLLTDADVDLVALVNQARAVRAWLLDDHAHPGHYRLAEVLVEYLCERYGIQRRGKGDRIVNLESIYRRYLLPFLIELNASLPAEQRGVAALRLRHLERLPAILAGDEQLPAATVAGDQLGRRGIACIFLDLADASRVVKGGPGTLCWRVAGSGRGVAPSSTEWGGDLRTPTRHGQHHTDLERLGAADEAPSASRSWALSAWTNRSSVGEA